MFRVKIAVLTLLLSGSVLVGLGLYFLSVVDRLGLARIDREILALGEGHLAARPSERYWQDFGASLQFLYGKEKSKDLIVQVTNWQKEILFRSAHWPAEITEGYFPEFNRAMAADPPGPPRREAEPGPPFEAYKACEGRTEGSMARFTGPGGEMLEGTCERESGGRLVVRPFANRGGGDGQRQGSQGDRQLSRDQGPDQGNRPMPRLKKTPYFATIRTPSGLWRVGIMGTDRITVIAGANMAGLMEDVSRYRRTFLSVVPVALLLLAGGGWVIARRALKPVALITRTAEGITAHGLDRRVPLTDADRELARLVEVINGMLDRLEKSFGQAVRFSADAAHELQTPLTILQGELDDAVQHAPVGSEEQQRYSGLLEEVRQLKAIVQKLLILARADAGRLDLALRTVDLSAMIESAAEDAEVTAPHLTIEKRLVPGLFVKADADLMGQVLRNLTSNAVKYNIENGVVGFHLSVKDHMARFTISNTGAPIPAGDREKVFDRFYRVDHSRSGRVHGSGLGLSLAREIVLAHGGDLRLDPDSGDRVSFTMSLPL